MGKIITKITIHVVVQFLKNKLIMKELTAAIQKEINRKSICLY